MSKMAKAFFAEVERPLVQFQEPVESRLSATQNEGDVAVPDHRLSVMQSTRNNTFKRIAHVDKIDLHTIFQPSLPSVLEIDCRIGCCVTPKSSHILSREKVARMSRSTLLYLACAHASNN